MEKKHPFFFHDAFRTGPFLDGPNPCAWLGQLWDNRKEISPEFYLNHQLGKSLKSVSKPL